MLDFTISNVRQKYQIVLISLTPWFQMTEKNIWSLWFLWKYNFIVRLKYLIIFKMSDSRSQFQMFVKNICPPRQKLLHKISILNSSFSFVRLYEFKCPTKYFDQLKLSDSTNSKVQLKYLILLNCQTQRFQISGNIFWSVDFVWL